MDDFCIVCSRTIVWPDLATEETPAVGAAISGSSSRGDAQSQHGSEDGTAASSGMQRTGSGNRATGAAKHGHHHHHPHRARHAAGGYHHGVKIRKNHSSAKLAGTKSAIKALAASSNATTSTSSQAQPVQPEDAVTESNLPNWMSLYCSEECRNEDELRARLSFANLNEQRIRLSPSPPVVNGGTRTMVSRFTTALPSSPLSQGSEGSDFDWSARSNGRRDSGADIASRRYSDGSEGSHMAGSRKGSRMRGSNDSLASFGDYDNVTSYRPDVHRSTSALSSGLRAMTPIHLVHSPAFGSPRESTSPQRKSGSPTSLLHKTGKTSLSPNAAATSMMIRSNSELSSSSVGPSTSTFIPSSAQTFKPASVGRTGLKPSKSSATLALTEGSDVRATLATEHREQSTYKQTQAGYSSRKHPHRASSSSIPYLSCSPSSPGSGSVASARSTYSTEPSSSSARGEHEDACYPESRKRSPYSDERDKPASLMDYGLFFKRTPSTPSLSTLHYQSQYTGQHSVAHGNSRLSASFDAKSGAIPANVLARQQRNKSFSNLQMTSSRRTSYEAQHTRRELHRSETSDSTPTQSVHTSRAGSFTQSAHDGDHLSVSMPGRSRASSITRPQMERLPSSGSTGSYTAMRQTPSQLRHSMSHHSDYFDSHGEQALQSEDYTLSTNHSRALNASHRSKSRSSFTWDHLPAYIPQYQAMDLEKIRRNKSGSSLHSVSEEPGAKSKNGLHPQQAQAPPTHRKRLFYFPDEIW